MNPYVVLTVLRLTVSYEEKFAQNIRQGFVTIFLVVMIIFTLSIEAQGKTEREPVKRYTFKIFSNYVVPSWGRMGFGSLIWVSVNSLTSKT